MTRLIALFLIASGGMAQQQQQQLPQEPQKRQNTRAELDALQTQIATTEAMLSRLRTTYKENHPGIVAMNERLRELQAQMARSRAAISSINSVQSRLELPDRWWRDQATAQSVGLSTSQQARMDDVFRQYRLKLIDLDSDLERQELLLEPLVEAEPLDESKITAQIDRVAQARAELEKANGRMLLGIRKVLTPEQFTKLNQAFSVVPRARR